MERKIGETFEYEGKKLKVVEGGNKCDKCYFYKDTYCTRIDRIAGACSMSRRIDNESVNFVEVKDEQPYEQDEQPQKLNLCEILKYCPNGELFWSPLLGDVKLYDIDKEAKTIDVTAKDLATWEINADGTITIDDITSEVIMLYPSREQRDWTKVKYEPQKERFDPNTLKAFDKVLCKQHDDTWQCNMYSHMSPHKEPVDYPYHCMSNTFMYCIPYNDDTKHLVGTKEEAPGYYRYWED